MIEIYECTGCHRLRRWPRDFRIPSIPVCKDCEIVNALAELREERARRSWFDRFLSWLGVP